MKKSGPRKSASPSREIDARIKAQGDWRGKTLGRFRALIKAADPDVVETVKWRKPSNPAGVPVWEHAGIVCIGDIFKSHVRVTFLKGALLEDPKRLFNASLQGNALRAVALYEGDKVDESAFKALVRAAVAVNKRARSRTPTARRRPGTS